MSTFSSTPTEEFSCEHFIARTRDDIQLTLERYGVCIVPSVLNPEECAAMVSGAWDYLEHVTGNTTEPIRRAEPNSWKGIFQLEPLHGSLIQRVGIGQAQFSWDVRANPNVIDVFSRIWETRDLIVSFDGASLGMPPETTNRGWYRKADWLHVDQSPQRINIECIQGWVTGENVEPGDATLVVLEASHSYFSDLSSVFGCIEPKNWYLLTPEQIQYFEIDRKCTRRSIVCPAGSLVLWDSRIIHQGREVLKGRPGTPKIRCVSYVCYTPRTFASPKILKKRRDAVRNMRTTTHWPHKCLLFPSKMRWGSFPDGIRFPNPPNMNDVSRSLI